MKRFGAALTWVVLAVFSASAQAEVRLAEPAEYGLFITPKQALEPGERLLTLRAPTLDSTDQIPARLGTKFGLRMRLAGKQAGAAPLTLLYLTPGVVTPDGQRHDKFELLQKVTPEMEQEVMAFEFTESYEVVPGEWHFMVFQGDRKIAEQRFQVR